MNYLSNGGGPYRGPFFMDTLSIVNPFNANVYFVKETSSTMEDIKSLENPDNGTIVTAAYQRSGRGRIPGRTWIGDRTSGLYFSIFLDSSTFAFPLSSLSARTGFAVAGFLNKEFGLNVKVKWPNDALIGGKKIAGILAEANKNKVALGIGINCMRKDFGELNDKATSIFLETGSKMTPVKCLENFLPYLYSAIVYPIELDEHKNLIYKFGSVISIRTGDPESGELLSGKVAGMNKDGALILETPEGVRLVYSGESVQSP